MLKRLKIAFYILIAIVIGPFHISAYNDAKNFTVVIDAGHGGKDIGATDNGIMEKNINLQVAKQLEGMIKKKMKNVKVVMTRDDDSYLTLQQRADVANKAQGDIFVSIHTNSVDKKNKNRKNLAGSSVYTLGLHKDENNLAVAMRENSVIELETDYEQIYSGFDPQRDESYIIFEMAQKRNLNQSIQLADQIEKELVKSGRENRGVHQAGFWVLWATSMPSVLVELDFICNPESAKYLSSEKGGKELAEAIFKAIEKYEDSWKKSLASSSKTELTETYIADSNNNLEDTYTVINSTPVVKSKKKEHRELKVNNTGVRKRRSEAAKQLSINKSYEKEDMILPNNKQYYELAYAAAVEETHSEIPDTPQGESSKQKSAKQKNDKKKQKEQKQSKKRKDDAYNAKVNKLVTVYKIQLLASSDLLNQSNSRFCGLSPISTYKENNLYKYYYGESTNKEELEALLADVKKKIPDAFIVSSTKSVQTNK